jgi:hypothetical protein
MRCTSTTVAPAAIASDAAVCLRAYRSELLAIATRSTAKATCSASSEDLAIGPRWGPWPPDHATGNARHRGAVTDCDTSEQLAERGSDRGRVRCGRACTPAAPPTAVVADPTLPLPAMGAGLATPDWIPSSKFCADVDLPSLQRLHLRKACCRIECNHETPRDLGRGRSLRNIGGE